MSDEPCEHNITGPCRICCMVERDVMVAKDDHETIRRLRDALGGAKRALEAVLSKQCGDGKKHCHHMGPLLRAIAEPALEAIRKLAP